MRILDLFSGIGGFSLGLERACFEFETIAFCEKDPACRKVLEKHWPGTPIFEDVAELSGDDVGEIDIICGGFPCQDISVAGHKRGLYDEKLARALEAMGMTKDEAHEEARTDRSGLWFHFRRLINELSPKYVLVENVAHLRSKGMDRVLQDLWALGYDAEWYIIPAFAVGSVHRRERIWIFAYPNKARREGHGSPERTPAKDADAWDFRSGGPTPDAYDLRFRIAASTEEEKSKWRAKTAARFRHVFGQIATIEPSICRGDDGLPRGVDKPRRERVKQLGNSVLPQIPQLFGEVIEEYENENNRQS